MSAKKPNRNVFLNCPFDSEYQPLFETLIFTTVACGYNPRCSRENRDTSKSRLDFILSVIKQCRLGIHDLSRERAKLAGEYSRFNLPFELGIQLSRKELGVKKNREEMRLLILEQEQYELQKALSDINGFDPEHHLNQPNKLMAVIRDFLQGDPLTDDVPGIAFIRNAKEKFDVLLETTLCPELGLDRDRIPYPEYVYLSAEFCRSEL